LRTGSESRRTATGALLVLGLAAAFFLFFQLTKQNPALSAVNASAEDPYDAIGSFGIQAAAFFGLISVARFFWWSRGDGRLSSRHRFLTLRAEMATVLAVAVTLAGDLVAMMRHPALWTGPSAGREYAAWLGILVVLDAAVGLYVGLASRGTSGPWATKDWLWAGSAVFALLAVLALYPENLRQSTAGALLTVLVGIVLLFAPVRFLLVALIPDSAVRPTDEGPASVWFARRGFHWAAVAVAGALAGVLLVSAEMLKESGGAAPPLTQLLLVVSVYVGLEMAGLLVGYALLREPVGMTVGRSPNKRIIGAPERSDRLGAHGAQVMRQALDDMT
jgi:hypothetical protein